MGRRKASKEMKTVTNVYGALSASIFAQFIPNVTAQLFGICLFCMVLPAAYVIRRLSKEPDGLVKNHMTFIIRTIWLSSFALTIGTTIGSAFIYNYGDNTVIYEFFDRIRTGSLIGLYDLEGVIKMYMIRNKSLIVSTAIFSLGPCVIYIAFRLARGLSRAMKGHRIGNPNAWL